MTATPDAARPRGQTDAARPRGQTDDTRPRGHNDAARPRGHNDAARPRGHNAATQSPTNAAMVWAPWTDKKGHLHPLRATVLVLLTLPMLWTALRLGLGMMGGRPINAAVHSTGYWAVSFLVASLLVSPAKALFGMPGLIVVRRMIGNAALVYALVHLCLYATDENWRLLTVIREIAVRFYLTIGFVALLGLIALGATSTDGAMRRMGARWKRLHRLVYGIAGLALIHFVLQTKADVSVPLLFFGVFAFVMLWRMLPAGRDRGPLAIAGLTLAAACLTAAAEWLWYRFGTHVDVARVMSAELDLGFGLRPVDQVVMFGVLLLVAQRLYIQSVRQLGQHVGFWVLLFALGAAVNELIIYAFGIDRFLDPDDWSWLWHDLSWAALLALLGAVRWRVADSGARHAVDALGVACVAFQVMLASNGLRGPGIVFACAIALAWALLAWRSWGRTKLAAVTWAPLCAMLFFGVSSLT